MSYALKYMEKLVGPTTVGLLLRAYRTRHDVTQAQVAKLLKASKSYVSDLENDRKPLSVMQAKHIAEMLGESTELYVQVRIEQDLREAGMDKILALSPISKSRIKGSGSSQRQVILNRVTTKKKATRRLASKKH